MSVSGISSNNLFSYYNTQDVQSKMKQFQQEFQQLGQNLQSGNLSAAQSDYATLEQLMPQNNSTSSTQSSNSFTQAFNQLATDLQAGNLSAAQQDFSTIQQDFQNQRPQMQGARTHGHHHHGGEESGMNQINQLLDQLGQALQSGNLSTAEQVFSSLQQEFQQFSQSNGLSSAQKSSQPSSTSISVNA
jgi:soluble cytochrome b562